MLLLGTQGWNYSAWVGSFYPTGTRPADFLTTYARAFPTVEVDSTFYAVPPERTVLGWHERTPSGFTFALKLPQEITHERRLQDAEDVTELFLERVRLLGDKLGPILIQFGPDFGVSNMPALERYLPTLPRDIRFAVELRQRQWITDELLELLTAHRVALTLSDGRWIPRDTLFELTERPTADFTYVRWMGPDRSIEDFSRTQVDRSRELESWSEVLRSLVKRVMVYGYANNHYAGHSPATVRELQVLLGQKPVEPKMLGEQISLF